MRRKLLIAVVLGLAGCGRAATATADALDPDEVVSSLAARSGATFAIRKTFSGGATGDTLHEAWACRQSLSDCTRLAIVDTDDGPPPTWRETPAQVELMIAPTDTVWNFANFFWGPNKTPQRVYLIEKHE